MAITLIPQLPSVCSVLVEKLKKQRELSKKLALELLSVYSNSELPMPTLDDDVLDFLQEVQSEKEKGGE